MLVAWLHFALGLGALAATITFWHKESLATPLRAGASVLCFIVSAVGFYFGAEILRAYYADEQTGWGVFEDITELQFNYIFAAIAFVGTAVAGWMAVRDISVRLSDAPNPPAGSLVTDLILMALGAWFFFDYVGRIQ